MALDINNENFKMYETTSAEPVIMLIYFSCKT